MRPIKAFLFEDDSDMTRLLEAVIKVPAVLFQAIPPRHSVRSTAYRSAVAQSNPPVQMS